MQKQIVLRFASKCKRCNGAIAAGTQAYWLGKSSGVMHITCPNSEERKPIEVGTSEVLPAGADEMTFDFSELREKFLKWTNEGWRSVLTPTNRLMGEHLPSASGSWSRPGFVGCSMAEMHEWIRNGYHVPGLDGISSLVPSRPKRRVKYGEEGDELLIDLVQSGDDNPFMEWEKRLSKPGLSIDLFCNFNAHFPASVLTAFQRWIARALQTLDENGVDMEVNLVYHARGIFGDKQKQKQTITRIRVRRPGEAADFSNWSPMFSPGGFRMLGFTAYVLHADARGYTAPYGLGASIPRKEWGVTFDPESRRIAITGDEHNPTFPEFEMTQQLQSVLSQLTGV